jgi:carboxyl-terminal processing protease
VDREDMDLAVDQHYVRESDLASHLTNARAREADQPSVMMRYYLPNDVRERLREAAPEDLEENEQEQEFLLRFSQQLLATVQHSGRRQMLSEAGPVIERARRDELARAVAELRTLGVDWTEGTDQGASDVRVEVSTNRPDNTSTAGEELELRVRVTNTGAAPLFQLRAVTDSDYSLFDGRELVFGRLDPGQTREWSTTLGICTTENERRTCRLPRQLPDRADGIRIEFEEAHGHAPPPAEVRTQVRALARPRFSYQLQVADVGGNGDGRVQRGEQVTIFMHLRNTGAGRSFDTQANLRNLSGAGVLLRAGRFEIDDILPNQERTVAFTFDVAQDFERDSARLEVSVVDTDLREAMTERIDVPIADAGSAPTARRGRTTINANAAIREAPSAEANVVSHVRGGAIGVPVEAEMNGFLRVTIGEGHPAWVAASDTSSSARPAREARITDDLNHMPPEIALQIPSLVTNEASLRLRGTARDESSVRDIYVYVGDRKVYYQSNRGGSNGREAAFDANLPLRPGTNFIVVVARENDQSISREAFVVRRDGPNGQLLETPTGADEWYHFGVEEEE